MNRHQGYVYDLLNREHDGMLGYVKTSLETTLRPKPATFRTMLAYFLIFFFGSLAGFWAGSNHTATDALARRPHSLDINAPLRCELLLPSYLAETYTTIPCGG